MMLRYLGLPRPAGMRTMPPMPTASFAGVPFPFTTVTPWRNGIATVTVTAFPARYLELFGRSRVGDLVLPGRTTRAIVDSRGWSKVAEGELTLTVTFQEDPTMPMREVKLTVEERLGFMTDARAPLPCHLFLTAVETGSGCHRAEVPWLAERERVAIWTSLTGAPPAVIIHASLSPSAFIVYRHLARKNGALVWLYTTDEPDPVEGVEVVATG